MSAPSHLPWSSDALLNKAKLYLQKMESYSVDDWEHGLWSTLALELLARAALASFSPVLLADQKSWRNLTYALGFDATAKRFSPNSISTTEVLARLSELSSEVTSEIAGFCSQHIERRNGELHSGELVFSQLGTSQWLPNFYSAIEVFGELLQQDLSELCRDPVSAKAMIDSLKDQAAKAVQSDINAYGKVWLDKSAAEREKASDQAAIWATKHSGHRVVCPACKSPALLQGGPSGSVSTVVDHAQGELMQRQTMLPTSFECIACGLRISGLSRLSACGLGDAFISTSKYTAAEFFDLYTEDDLEEARQEGKHQWEPDFNE